MAGTLIADAGYGSAKRLDWLVHERGSEPHIPIFDRSRRQDETFSREDFAYDRHQDRYTSPAGKTLELYRRRFATLRNGINQNKTLRYRASQGDCRVCELKSRCCPNAPARKATRSIFEGAGDMAQAIARPMPTGCHDASERRSRLFAHLKRILKVDCLRLRGPNGARDEFHLAATVQNIRKMAKLYAAKQLIPAT
ncbi:MULTISPECIES: transposase [unclassified Aureimonas]|uniref:transposase n=1 Tax=Aureimonas sp. Leaf427 TaxID=1736375 RepID=UPI0006F48F2B|nr:hypothetical protein ASG54_23450 [Aureimonas sp. Leaf460]KQT61904.1 hypothetical protein ASG62_23615 [Aureimonas sp. Leaf427]